VPFLTIDQARLFYRLQGAEDRPALILSNSLGTDHSMWAPQVPGLLAHFRVLRYDTRGHGASDVPPGDYTLDRLGRDVLALADGLSLGGMTAQWLGANAPERVTALVLANTSALMAPKSAWNERARLVLEKGMRAFVDTAMQRFFTEEFRAQNPATLGSTRATFLATDPAGYAGCCAAIRDMDQTPLLPKITTPSLLMIGDRDVATPWTGHGEILAAQIPGVKVAHLPAAHLSNLERPRSFTSALLDFLLPPAVADPRDAGMAMRRATLGDAHVDRSMAAATDFNRPFLDLITRYAWGSVWTRPGLDRRTRRLLVLATTVALGRWEEFRLHLRAGLAQELEPCDVKEVLLQAAVYAGVPAANTAFQIAKEEVESGK
jgi:3-oxoadipate enol-lactonase/4-carboxymuconolactone decarboxylase